MSEEEPRKEGTAKDTREDPGAAPASTTSPASEAPAPSAKTRRRPSRTFLLVLTFLLVSQPLLLLVVLAPYWWASLPILSIWGVIGWKRSWLWAPLLGFLLGFGYWGALLLSLPAGPRGRLAVIIGASLGVSPTVATLIGPLLLGVLAAFGALTVAGGLRLWDEVRPLPLPTGGEPSAR